ncbi:MAG: glycosyltransferase family 39 protein [Phycisphaerales bacterium]|nr:glycosyltransferase family 39 protein [Phycisphaerales bacterium]MCB9857308.1 glycosyltransferase family 39 protein [Phycisphaerales bacterium]MCB9862978.1 glycosyltransferase family 39 protein [Phycisphaerales bacterium]
MIGASWGLASGRAGGMMAGVDEIGEERTFAEAGGLNADESQKATLDGGSDRRWNLRMSPRRFLVWACLLVGVYGFGLTRDLSEPWYGVHDWNGAFFSQLARNFLRYPMSLHHGMPIVAAGAAIPGPEDSSIYATHPPGLVWLVAASFKVFGESEWAARLVPIVFSLGTYILLLWLTSKAHSRRIAAIAGLFYAVMPMSVYFGRMVDHEAVCLFCMVAAAAGWTLAGRGGGWRWLGLSVVVACVWVGVWVDWSVVIFFGLMAVLATIEAVRHRGRWRDCLVVSIGGLAAVVSMVSFIVYAGLAGRWGDLVDIFVSRAGEHVDIKGAGTSEEWWRHVIDNVSWLLAAMAVVGLIVMIVRWRRPAKVDSGDIRSRSGLNVVAMTGLLWVVVFWKQFERHEYWMFYLGPAIATLGAVAISTFVDMAWRARATASVVAMAALAPLSVVIEVQFRNVMFDRVHQVHPMAIEDWTAIGRMTAPTDVVAMYDDPYRVERRGGYEFRNIVPPHLAWYMDRRLKVVTDVSELPASAAGCAVFVIDAMQAESVRDRLDPLLRTWGFRNLHRQLVVDLRTPPGRGVEVLD